MKDEVFNSSRRLLRACRKAEGLCSHCPNSDRKIQKALPGKSRCKRCLDKLKKNRKILFTKRRELGLCISCPEYLNVKVSDGHTRCDKCLKKRRGEDKKLRLKYQRLGICYRCRERPLVEDSSTCKECLLGHATRMREWRERNSKQSL